MTLETWIAFCVITTVLCFVPGPAVLFVTSLALAGGARPGLAATLGILVANVFYFALSATSVAATIAASSQLFVVLRWVGAIYLCWMGAGMLFARREIAHAPSPQVVQHAFLRALAVQLMNPTAFAYFVALLPQFIDPSGRVGWQVFVLGASGTVIELGALGVYVLAAARTRVLAGVQRAGLLVRVGGALLLAAGLRLALVRAG
jgi:homoserine/homoserine lactone efflux protein